MFSIAVLPHSPGVVYYHLLLRRETRIPGVAPFSFRIGIWDLFVHRGQKSYTPTAFREVVDHSRSKMHYTCLFIIHDPGMRPGPDYTIVIVMPHPNIKRLIQTLPYTVYVSPCPRYSPVLRLTWRLITWWSGWRPTRSGSSASVIRPDSSSRSSACRWTPFCDIATRQRSLRASGRTWTRHW